MLSEEEAECGTKHSKKQWLVPETIREFTKLDESDDLTEEERNAQKKKLHTFHLNVFQRLFLLLDQPDRSHLGFLFSVITLITIILSCISFILASSPSFQYSPDDCADPACDDDPDLCPGKKMCEPVELKVFGVIEVVCITIFSMDYVPRISIVSFMPTRCPLKDTTKYVLLYLQVHLFLKVLHFLIYYYCCCDY